MTAPGGGPGEDGGLGGGSGLGGYLVSWAPGPVGAADELAPGPAAALSALLDLPRPAVPQAGDALPPLWHWLYFLDWPGQAELGDDGHPRHGHFLPPLPHRQRMFAGGRCEIAEPLRLGEPAHRTTSLGPVTVKRGTTGELLFVTTRSEFRQRGRVRLVEEQDIVYRSGRAPNQAAELGLGTGVAPDADEPWRLPLTPDPVLLFRFSALTANAHRIHYDATYTREVEGHPGLVVHGPLLVIAMLELVRRDAADRRVRSLSYRLRRPAFAGEHLLACGGPTVLDGGRPGARAALRVATHREDRHATAEVTFA
ncbi:hypothetical protein HII36_23320 [Nonomuraea sp. NN258]|uniref:hypothetical protein n=1 Tax=Nonomuraea antri TaxID=2730852 RepID=UPI001C2B9248|nr:hypothetical protein [Nonomuraea antri]NRQ34740.1 hypothetical protein [Nonomuraea antri]